jgi:hypothetical protein
VYIQVCFFVFYLSSFPVLNFPFGSVSLLGLPYLFMCFKCVCIGLLKHFYCGCLSSVSVAFSPHVWGLSGSWCDEWVLIDTWTFLFCVISDFHCHLSSRWKLNLISIFWLNWVLLSLLQQRKGVVNLVLSEGDEGQWRTSALVCGSEWLLPTAE